MFEKGDRVIVTREDSGERVEGTFLSQGAPEDAIERDGRQVEVGWVQYGGGDEQLTGKHPYDEIQRA